MYRGAPQLQNGFTSAPRVESVHLTFPSLGRTGGETPSDGQGAVARGTRPQNDISVGRSEQWLMELSSALCLFSARVEARDGEYVVTVPEREVDLETLEAGGTYRVGVYPGASATSGTAGRNSDESASGSRTTASTPERTATPESTDSTPDQPPVSEGETRRLQVEDVGDQGDGLARVGPGYVVFVPDTDVGQQPLVRITTVRENFAFAEVLER